MSEKPMASFNKHSYLSPAPKNHTLCMRSMASLSFANENRDPSRVLTLLGLGLIKINDVSANFNNPRPSLILNN